MAVTLRTKRQRGYSESALKSALICVRDGGLSYRKAGKINGVPPETLRDYCKDPSKKQMGTSTKFGKDEEEGDFVLFGSYESASG